MARLTDALIGAKAYAVGRKAPMVDLKNGGQFGFAPDYPSIVSNQQYIRRNLIPVLIEAPRGFNDLPDTPKWNEALKALVELHAKSIEGLQAGLSVETSSTPVGGAGEEQEDVTNVTRARSNVSFTWVEKYGRPINAFLNAWIRELLMDPATKVPGVVARGKKPGDLLLDYIGMTMMFIEPDPTFTKVDKAWLVCGMYPKSDGPIEGRRDLTSGGNNVELNIEFTGVSQIGEGVNQFAQRLLDEMNLTGTSPNSRTAFIDKIAADVKAGASGYAEQIAMMGRTAVQP